MDFIETHIKGMQEFGFWSEESKHSIITAIESRYKTEIIRDWTIIDFVVNEHMVLVNWVKRFQSLTDEDLREKYGRH